MNECQRQTLEGISPKGFHLNRGTPCCHDPEKYVTRKKRGYSDFVTYYHRCTICDNEFSTYIEG